MKKFFCFLGLLVLTSTMSGQDLNVGFRGLYLTQTRLASDSVLQVEFKQKSVVGDSLYSYAWFWDDEQKSSAELGCEYAGDTLCIRLHDIKLKHRNARMTNIEFSVERIPHSQYDDGQISTEQCKRALRILHDGLSRKFGQPSSAKLYKDSARLNDSISWLSARSTIECARWDLGGSKALPNARIILAMRWTSSYGYQPQVEMIDLQNQRQEEDERRRLEDERRHRDANPTINTKF